MFVDLFFFFKQKTAYEMRISDWSSDVCSSDLTKRLVEDHARQMLEQVITDGTWTEPKPRAIITDHAAEDRATLEKHLGLKTKPAKKTVGDGLQAVASRFRDGGNGKPRMLIMQDCLVEIAPALRDDEIGKAECREKGGQD